MAGMDDDDFWGGGGAPEYGAGGGGFEGGTGYQGLGFFGADPFGYTGGSLLTPWTQAFNAPNQPGAQGIDMDPFSYADFGYDYKAPGAFKGQQDIAPDYFGYGEFQSPEQFKAPTAADMEQDPGYQFRLQQGQNAMLNNAAASGLARSGGFAKGMADYNQGAASQEYKDVYGRRASEYDRNAQLARGDWDRRRGNAFEQSKENWGRTFDTGQANNQNRLAAYQASTDANIRGGQLGYEVASGVYDRNRQNAQDAYNSAMQIAQSRASAGGANADQAYNRALNEYQMAYDIFNQNQDRQWNRLTQMTGMGMDAAGQQGQYGQGYANNVGSAYGQAANAQAGSAMAQGQNWANAAQGIGDAAGMYMWGKSQQNPRATVPWIGATTGIGSNVPGQTVPPLSLPQAPWSGQVPYGQIRLGG